MTGSSKKDTDLSQKEPSYQELVDFARWTQTFWKNGIEIMRKNNLVIKSDEPMEKLAFTFYTDLCEIDSKAGHLFQEGYGDENYKNESAIECQTIKAYPKPYEEKIRQAAINGVLEDIWKFCLINGAEEHGDLIGAPTDGFFTLKLLKKIAEMRYEARHRQQEEEGGGER